MVHACIITEKESLQMAGDSFFYDKTLHLTLQLLLRFWKSMV